MPIPPDPENMNAARVEWAAAALRHFQCITGADYEDALGDLLCDLLHWSDRNNFDFDAALDRARMHYEAETESHGTDDKRVPGPLKSVLEKALDEVSQGNPEKGERLLELALLKDADTGELIRQMLEALDDLHRYCHPSAQYLNSPTAAKVIAAIAQATGGAA